MTNELKALDHFLNKIKMRPFEFVEGELRDTPKTSILLQER
jgi:hypothetical protein